MAVAGYPKVGGTAWRALRAKAAAAPSTKFTPGTVAALLGMANPHSARNNIVLPMSRLGLIDDDGTLTPRGNKWRSDGSYTEACQEILDSIYPAELLALTNADGSPSQQAVKTWFDHQGFGDSNARQMAATYSMIASRQVPEVPSGDSGKASVQKQQTKKSAPPAVGKKDGTRNGSGSAEEQTPAKPDTSGPNVHLDIQIHIPADASAEQIDQIFASMAKHLYKQ